MKILILNGPNLNLLGTREKTIYGSESFDQYFEELVRVFPDFTLEYFQSNIEGEIINKIHEVRFTFDGIVLNAAAYTHTSVAIRDAISAVDIPIIEVHISNVHQREAFRHTSMISASCVGVIAGFGLDSYRLGVEALSKINQDK
ncbi:type II 3-dehydroquinate dehydratase [Ancylomarina euxinus]|uniref:3-dehydroquinate dehydratase n=1 Tax=Ancylomarina euxinus TaxID=2283627 RepID=A0A425XX84_9BACT|nr:type II 3-dehydroquinate dehydratase [Ancylomarina euxinus]MCZ4696149.1 type II 3-dehydroquinate dehydratase [Ancylomarina euxinus]MUP16558.1 type II 3-dehydroquinate dehydratase [Ancylomarina euxinus]RRG19263.1 type II 3-dehydroquinate dehydratase [Ancylomarina euxinus]